MEQPRQDYAVRLHEAAEHADRSNHGPERDLLLAMVACLVSGDHQRLRRTFHVLRPFYRSRVGPPPGETASAAAERRGA